MRHWLDDIARGLATPGVSRRAALRRLGAGVVAGALTTLGRQGAAQAVDRPGGALEAGVLPQQACPPGTTPCGFTCCGESEGHICVNGECCPSDQVCGSGFGATCCPPGKQCCVSISRGTGACCCRGRSRSPSCGRISGSSQARRSSRSCAMPPGA